MPAEESYSLKHTTCFRDSALQHFRVNFIFPISIFFRSLGQQNYKLS